MHSDVMVTGVHSDVMVTGMHSDVMVTGVIQTSAVRFEKSRFCMASYLCQVSKFKPHIPQGLE